MDPRPSAQNPLDQPDRRPVVLWGGSGFSGAPLARLLLERGLRVRVVDDRRELADGLLPESSDLERISEQTLGSEPARVLADARALVHLRWRGIARSHPLDDFGERRLNVVPTRRVLAACRHVPVLFASSAGALLDDGACAGDGAPEDAPARPVRAYGRAKLLVEGWVLAHRAGGVVVRPTNPYGPGQAADARCGVVGTFLTRVAEGRPVTLFGDGDVERDFVYVDDLARAFVAALERALRGDRRLYHVGAGEPTSLARLLSAVEAAVGARAQVVNAPMRPGDRRRVFVDITRARRELRWEPRVGLEEGLSRTLAARGTATAKLPEPAVRPPVQGASARA